MSEKHSFFWHNVKTFIFRSFAIYLILIFLFISDYLNFYHFLPFLNTPLNAVTVFIDKTTARVFAVRPFTHTDFEDSYWTYMALFIYLLIAVIAGIVWTSVDKSQKNKNFFAYVRIFARYYLAAILLGYGIPKILGSQFGRPDYVTAIYPYGSFSMYSVFWKFMGVSESYQIFGGILETVAGLLLLFRRTATMGCLLTLAVLLNVLMLDIAHDTFVKVRVIYFLLVAIFILSPDIGRLFGFFILKQQISLTETPSAFQVQNYKWLHCALKAGLIALILFVIIRKNNWVYAQYHYPQYGSVSGIYKIRDFYINNKIRPQNSEYPIAWNKLAVNRYFPNAAIQLTNDSILAFDIKVDTIKKILLLIQPADPGFKSTLHFSHVKDNEWLFYGVFKNDSVRFTSEKFTGKLNIEKGYGKAIWVKDL